MMRATLCVISLSLLASTATAQEDPTARALEEISAMQVNPKDWPQWGGWSHRNNTPQGENIPSEWDVETGENILWSAPLGSQTYGNVVVANGKVYVGTNNHNAYLPRYPKYAAPHRG